MLHHMWVRLQLYLEMGDDRITREGDVRVELKGRKSCHPWKMVRLGYITDQWVSVTKRKVSLKASRYVGRYHFTNE